MGVLVEGRCGIPPLECGRPEATGNGYLGGTAEHPLKQSETYRRRDKVDTVERKETGEWMGGLRRSVV